MSASPIQASLSPKQVSEFSQNYQTFKTNHQKFTTVIQAPGKIQELQLTYAAIDFRDSYKAFKSNGKELLAVLQLDSDHYSKITKVLANCKLIFKDFKAQAIKTSEYEPKQVETSTTGPMTDEVAADISKFLTGLVQDCKQQKKKDEEGFNKALRKVESKHAKELQKCANKRERSKWQAWHDQMKKTAQSEYKESIQKLDNVIDALTKAQNDLKNNFKSFKTGKLNENDFKETAKTLFESLKAVIEKNSFKPTQVV